MKNTNYYKAIYENKMNEIYKQLKVENIKDIESVSVTEFDETATPEEIAGYYITHYGNDAFKQWAVNTNSIELSKQDKKINDILKNIYS